MKLHHDRIDVYVIDGHDKNTSGKRSFKFADESEIIENDYNEPLADEVVRLFKQDPKFRVTYVTPEDTFRSIANRANVVNLDYEKRGSRFDRAICISVHANAFGKKWNNANGTEALYYEGCKTGKKFATIISKKISNVYGIRNRGAKP